MARSYQQNLAPLDCCCCVLPANAADAFLSHFAPFPDGKGIT
jgi:hypothetical protein